MGNIGTMTILYFCRGDWPGREFGILDRTAKQNTTELTVPHSLTSQQASSGNGDLSPFALQLTSALGHGAVGSVYQGHIYGLSTQTVAKILPADRMDHELEIWRRLSRLSGISIPGLFGAYAVEGRMDARTPAPWSNNMQE